VFFLYYGLIWFGSDGKIKIANQTMWLSKKIDPNTSEPNTVFFFDFGLD